MTRWIGIVCACLWAIASSCSDPPSVPSASKLNGLLAGVWERAEGEFFDVTRLGNAEYLEFREDGSATIYRFKDTLSLATCQDVLYAVTSDGVFLLEVGGGEGDATSAAYLFSRSGNSLTIAENGQNSSSYSSANEVPQERRCLEFSEVELFEDLEPEPQGFSNLVYDGSLLWYGDDLDQLNAFDPETGELVDRTEFEDGFGDPTSVGGGTFSRLQTAGSTGFWAHCGCGGTEAAWQGNPTDNSEIDAIDTTEFFDGGISVRAMAWDGSHTWIHGFSFDSGVALFAQFDTEADPNVLVDSFEFDTSLRNLTWDGSLFWSIAGVFTAPTVIAIDPGTFLTVASYHAPRGKVQWNGLAAVGSDLYLLGEDASGAVRTGTIARVTP